MPDTVDTVTCVPDDRWRCHPKHVEQFADINKLYIVASFWIIIEAHGNITNYFVIWCHLNFSLT
jgi:hypothetical protein